MANSTMAFQRVSSLMTVHFSYVRTIDPSNGTLFSDQEASRDLPYPITSISHFIIPVISVINCDKNKSVKITTTPIETMNEIQWNTIKPQNRNMLVLLAWNPHLPESTWKDPEGSLSHGGFRFIQRKPSVMRWGWIPAACLIQAINLRGQTSNIRSKFGDIFYPIVNSLFAIMAI